MDNFSFVDIDDQSVELVMSAFANKKLNPEKVRVERASERDATARSEGKPAKKEKKRKR